LNSIFEILNFKYQQKVGTWKDNKITIDDIVWPGRRHKPPLGKPDIFHLKIATLEEPPFVIYKDLQKKGSCIQNSILVRISNDYNE
jgi:hypothetical protein